MLTMMLIFSDWDKLLDEGHNLSWIFLFCFLFSSFFFSLKKRWMIVVFVDAKKNSKIKKFPVCYCCSIINHQFISFLFFSLLCFMDSNNKKRTEYKKNEIMHELALNQYERCIFCMMMMMIILFWMLWLLYLYNLRSILIESSFFSKIFFFIHTKLK